jgi:hypothetical protein
MIAQYFGRFVLTLEHMGSMIDDQLRDTADHWICILAAFSATMTARS